MAHNKVVRIRELLDEEKSFPLCAHDASLEQQSYTANEYADLILQLKNLLYGVVSDDTKAGLDEIPLPLTRVDDIKTARSLLHGLVPDIEEQLQEWILKNQKQDEYIMEYIANSGYSTPYIDLMIKAIVELNISDENQPPIDHIKEWFEQQNEFWPYDKKLSGKEIDKLSSFVRSPERKKGGHYKVT